MLFLLGGVIYGIIGMLYKTNVNFNNMLFYIMSEVYYVLALYFLFLAYKNFRLTGGIHGALGTQKIKTSALTTPTKNGEK